MTYTCRAFCVGFKIGRGYKYSDGLKYCSECCLYFDTSDNRCVCCNNQLRVGAKNK